MRVLVQRVSKARVRVGDETVGEIGRGLLLLVGIKAGDGDAQLQWMARKCAALRVFPDEEGRMNRSLRDVGGDALAVSQFTLYSDATQGNRPGFTEAAHPDQAEPMYRRFCELLAEELGKPVAHGRFGAEMAVELTNDGPVTLLLERTP